MFDVVELIQKALEKKEESKILKFGSYQILEILGHGQQGMVLKASNPNGKYFAIKFYAPTDEDTQILNRSKERFVREAKILLNLKHKNIVNIIEAGSARFDENTLIWSLKNEFDVAEEILYYIMDFIQGEDSASLFYDKKNDDDKEYKIDKSKSTSSNHMIYEEMISQISEAIYYYHLNGVIHRDIKPDNIIYSRHDNNFIIVDFGFAKYYTKDEIQKYEMIRRQRYLDIDSIQSGKVDHFIDQHNFASMLLEILVLFESHYTSREYNGIKSCLEKASMPKREDRYSDLFKFAQAISPFLHRYPYKYFDFNFGSFLIPEARFGFFNTRLRIPFSGSIPFFDEVLTIIDSKHFQRLRGVFQLGPTQYVYPGAMHTRFEHSLGTYNLALKYLGTLLQNEDFYQAIEPVDESIKLVVLSALLHDIGHYPYSHWIEEISGLPLEKEFDGHEVRAQQIIKKGMIERIIIKDWNIDPEPIYRIISGKPVTNREELLNSIVDSDIDVDKIDYLQRDSSHCGVPYGVSLDVDRLIGSLWINENHDRICLSEKGRSSFSAMLMSNIVMYQEVYWHKTVRACSAMFKRYFYEGIKEGFINVNKLESKYFYLPDSMFMSTLYNLNKKKKEIRRLIEPFNYKNRILYKPAYVHYHGHQHHIRKRTIHKFFTNVSDLNYQEQIDMSNKFVEELRGNIPNMEEHDLLLESTPISYRAVAKLDGFQFYDYKTGQYESPTSEIDNLNQYLLNNKRSFIFCNPKYYDDIRALIKKGVLNKIINKIW